MTIRARSIVAFVAVLACGAVFAGVAHAQEARFVNRLSDAARAQVDAMLDSALAQGLPTEPLVDRALEGAAKRAPDDLIVTAVRRLWSELGAARQAFGEGASAGELGAGASALRAGATQEDLAQLRSLRPEQPLTMAAATLADLVAIGVPADTAISAVFALAGTAADADYMAFRSNVERDIALGASPTSALGVRLAAAADQLALEGAPTAGTTRSATEKRKP
jgi:hypothetical protein